MVSKHYNRQRYRREKLINKHCNGDGKVIDEFIVDKGISFVRIAVFSSSVNSPKFKSSNS